MSGLRQWMKRDEAERTEAISIDQMWSGVRPLSSLQFLWLLPGRRLGGEERPLWAHLLEGRDEHWAEERGSFSSDTSSSILYMVSGEVNVQHVQAAWIRHPPRLPPQTSLNRGECPTGLPQQPIGRLCQQTHGWSLISDERLRTFPDQRNVQDCGLPHPPGHTV